LEDKLPESIRQKRLAHDMAGGQIAPLIEQQTLRGYAALVTHIDSMIGVLLGTLREKGLLDNTHVLLTSDHGDALFDHGNVAKSDFFRGSTGVPYLVRPAPTWAGAHSFRPDRADMQHPVGLMDLMPTIMDLCGLETPGSVEGSSLVPLLLDVEAPFRELTYGVCGPVYGLSDGRYKYMWFGDQGIEFLFDTHEDPAEEHDLAGDPAMVGRRDACRDALVAWMAEHGDPHVQDGVLVAMEPGRADLGRARNVWNNRGWH
jgi:arylsulfatase A-like enzyme